jgi:predicted hotdog family 3-hydroxylacyl-ACP dehydratase
VQDLREYRRTIKEPCRSCDKARHCYGCRGAAYQLTGDYLASDPLCWRNVHRQKDIVRLPMAVDAIIPQQFPMRVIDTLIKVGERSAVATATASPTMPFVNDQGILDEAVYMEMIAQTIAAMNGFKHMNASGAHTQGLLVGAKKLEILGLARVGETLTISVYKQTRYGEFGILEGIVSRGDIALARGEIKIWHHNSENSKLSTEVEGR